MASEFVAMLQPNDLQREADLGRDPELNLAVTTVNGFATNDLYGSVLPKYVRGNLTNFGYVTLMRVPKNLTVGTGLTFVFYLTDDGQNAIDLGKTVELGVTLLDVTQGPSNFDLDSAETELATEQTVTATLAATSGKASVTSLPIALASLPPSLAAGDVLAVRIRRIGTSASDTCPGRVLLMCTAVNNT
jgi:hypothetical protein